MRIYKNDTLPFEDTELLVNELKHYTEAQVDYDSTLEVLELTTNKLVSKSKSVFKIGDKVFNLKGMKLGHLIRMLNLDEVNVIAKLLVASSGDRSAAELPATLLSDFSNHVVKFHRITTSPLQEVRNYSPINKDIRELDKDITINVFNNKLQDIAYEYNSTSDVLFTNTYPSADLAITRLSTRFVVPVLLTKRNIDDTSILNYGGIA